MKILVLFSMLAATSAHALIFDLGTYGVSAGVRRNLVQSDFGDEEAGLSLDIGFIKKYYLHDDLLFRTGFKFSQRYFEIADKDFDYVYVDLPLLLEYSIDKKWSTFFGFLIALNLNDSTEASPEPDANTTLTQLVGGAKYSINHRLDIEGYVELGMSEVADSIDDMNTFGVNLVYWFL
ncbi:MAG: outer membrane beta-barrel protein [Bacteriovoracaceae bacterium]|nr:outer membrane beta-barrel protein [Bacteriovoracaceae bacterium]